MEMKKEQYDIELRSPMGWIKVKAGLVVDSETEFRGEVKLLGLTVPMEDCVKNDSTYQFRASPKLPFGVLEVTISADVHADGTVTGIANAPRHKPMEIRGQMAAPSASAE